MIIIIKMKLLCNILFVLKTCELNSDEIKTVSQQV